MRKDEMIEFGGKSSLSLRHKSKRWKCFLIKPLIDGKLGLWQEKLNCENSLFLSLFLQLTKLFNESF